MDQNELKMDQKVLKMDQQGLEMHQKGLEDSTEVVQIEQKQQLKGAGACPARAEKGKG